MTHKSDNNSRHWKIHWKYSWLKPGTFIIIRWEPRCRILYIPCPFLLYKTFTWCAHSARFCQIIPPQRFPPYETKQCRFRSAGFRSTSFFHSCDIVYWTGPFSAILGKGRISAPKDTKKKSLGKSDMVLEKKVTIFDREWGRNSAPRDVQKRPCWKSREYDGSWSLSIFCFIHVINNRNMCTCSVRLKNLCAHIFFVWLDLLTVGDEKCHTVQPLDHDHGKTDSQARAQRLSAANHKVTWSILIGFKYSTARAKQRLPCVKRKVTVYVTCQCSENICFWRVIDHKYQAPCCVAWCTVLFRSI